MILSRLRGGRRGRGDDSILAARGRLQQQPGAGPGGVIVRGIATGIGLASEAYHHHKEKKAQKVKEDGNDSSLITQPSVPGDPSSQPVTLSQQVDEAAWQLDDAQQEVMGAKSPSPDVTDEQQPKELASTFLQRHAEPPSLASLNQRLALPVVITQKRPGKRTRGFIRAYALVLDDVGINEATFLEFIDDLNKAVLPNPWIQALNLASLAGMAAPEPFTILISIAVQKATNAVSAVHSRYKTNHFINEVNRSFFMPRGLIALIMTWKPSTPGEILTNVNTEMDPAITHAVNESEQSSIRKKFSQSNGATAFEWPETAPLVFPILDNVAATDEAQKQNSLKRTGAFVAEYMDSRSRAKWAGQNPDSKMANVGPKEQFHSRYSDPNHPASSGDPIALITGGRFKSIGGLRGVAPRPVPRSLAGPVNPRGLVVGGQGIVGAGVGVARKIFEQDILYLMIVQLPSLEQIAEARTYMPTADLQTTDI
ncbi:hypothetical protein F5B22DRAFT_608160 [Xylaria bambusicola]|uniref:uncharacterized protein n=1 Tax=Xylaria bambusicola TaxID=326684 RepID=UPI002007ACD5|nr:uncharacterized protein F5B22DRAFT_608160 [Xylaria bambusicola]KAI0515062.1 hypothetical protein F5B22DRAFT_608160 [Xylaria bambusicola]